MLRFHPQSIRFQRIISNPFYLEPHGYVAVTCPDLINPYLDPVALANCTYGTGSYAALWISMSLCIPTHLHTD